MRYNNFVRRDLRHHLLISAGRLHNHGLYDILTGFECLGLSALACGTYFGYRQVFIDAVRPYRYQVSLSWLLVAIGELFYFLTVKSGSVQLELEPSS
jgi:hypothetical protein